MYPVQWLYQGNVLVNVVADRVLRGSPREDPAVLCRFSSGFQIVSSALQNLFLPAIPFPLRSPFAEGSGQPPLPRRSRPSHEPSHVR